MFKLKELRLEAGLKRSKVANDLQMNAGTLANYENCIRQAPYESLIKFSEYFGVTIDCLLGNDEYVPAIKKGASFSTEEIELVNSYRKLSKLGKERVAEYIELWNNRE